MKHKKIQSKKTKDQQDLIPLSVIVKGSIPNSIARALDAICRLFEEIVESLIYKIRNKRKK